MTSTLWLLERMLRGQRIANELHRVSDGLVTLDLLRGKNSHISVEKLYIVLLDINMPRMSGFEFLEEVRHDDNLRHSVIFVFSTSETDQDRKVAYDKNMDGYIVKSDIESGFTNVINMLECYWKIVTLPT